MAYEQRDGCVDCADRTIHCFSCSRNHPYIVAVCDNCDKDGNEFNPILEYEDKMLCPECIFEELLKIGEIIQLEDDVFRFDGEDDGKVETIARFKDFFDEVEVEW